MDTRKRYELPPVAPADSQVWTDPSHSSKYPRHVIGSPIGDFNDITYSLGTGHIWA